MAACSPSEPTAVPSQSAVDKQIPPVVASVSPVRKLTESFPADAVPVSPADCKSWFDDWVGRFAEIESAAAAAAAAARTGDGQIANAVAGYGASMRATLADCLEGRTSDIELLIAEEKRLIEETS